MAENCLEKQKCKTNQPTELTAQYLTMELEDVGSNITYYLKLQKTNVLFRHVFCFSWCQVMLNETELLLVKPMETLAWCCLKQAPWPTLFSVASKKAHTVERTSILGRHLEVQRSGISRDSEPRLFLSCCVTHVSDLIAEFLTGQGPCDEMLDVIC